MTVSVHRKWDRLVLIDSPSFDKCYNMTHIFESLLIFIWLIFRNAWIKFFRSLISLNNYQHTSLQRATQIYIYFFFNLYLFLLTYFTNIHNTSEYEHYKLRIIHFSKSQI